MQSDRNEYDDIDDDMALDEFGFSPSNSSYKVQSNGMNSQKSNNQSILIEDDSDDREKAAIKIQSIQRQKLVKKELNAQKDGAIAIQKSYRGSKSRKDSKQRGTAPVPLPSNNNRDPNDDRDAAAAKIQAVHRGKRGRKQANQEQAARSIQAAERRRTAQKKYANDRKGSKTKTKTKTKKCGR